MEKNTKKTKGFTLIELLVVVAIIGILASVVLASLNTARAKARDTKRVAEMKQLSTALELYYADNGNYPGGSQHYRSIASPCSVGAVGSPLWTSAGVFDSNFTSKYMSTLPVEPLSGVECLTYSNFQTGWATSLRCFSVSAPSVEINPADYYYMLTFVAETNSSYSSFPGMWSSVNARRCLLGPKR